MSNDIAIKVENLTKTYKLYNAPIDRLKEALHPLKKKYHKDFHALNDISFEIKKGETVGIIGKNGSGKSTLLKIITGVLTQTAGKVSINGRVAALLELGAGFNPEYSGMENIYFQGNLMGFSHEEMADRVKNILDFADIGEFINQPVKNYSSGMFARLAFAVAINVEPDVLIVDEALSVGDMFFQAKCYNKFQDLQKNGTTILFVTHDMGSIIKYCQTGVLINKGNTVSIGKPKDVVDIYKKLLVNQEVEELQRDTTDWPDKPDIQKKWKDIIDVNPHADFYGDGSAEIIDFATFDALGKVSTVLFQGDDFTFKFRVKFLKIVRKPFFAFGIKDVKGNEILGSNNIIENVPTDTYNPGIIVEVSFRQRNILKNGNYIISCACTGENDGDFIVYARGYNLFSFETIADRGAVGFVQSFSNIHITKE